MGRRAFFPLLLVAAGALAAPSQPGEAADIHDIRGPLPLAGTLPFALTSGALLLMGGLLLVHRRREAATPPPSRATRFDARDLLALVVAEYRQGDCANDQIIVRLDKLLRDALAASTGILAHRRTSAELLAEASAYLNQAAWTRLDDLLSLCDRVKFAGQRPDRAEVERALASVACFLEELPEARVA